MGKENYHRQPSGPGLCVQKRAFRGPEPYLSGQCPTLSGDAVGLLQGSYYQQRCGEISRLAQTDRGGANPIEADAESAQKMKHEVVVKILRSGAGAPIPGIDTQLASGLRSSRPPEISDGLTQIGFEIRHWPVPVS